VGEFESCKIDGEDRLLVHDRYVVFLSQASELSTFSEWRSNFAVRLSPEERRKEHRHGRTLLILSIVSVRKAWQAAHIDECDFRSRKCMGLESLLPTGRLCFISLL
jgi:hypothetical protein